MEETKKKKEQSPIILLIKLIVLGILIFYIPNGSISILGMNAGVTFTAVFFWWLLIKSEIY